MMEYKKEYRNLVLSGGLFLGLFLSIESVAGYLWGGTIPLWIFTMYGIGVTVYVFMRFGARAAAVRPVELGFSYGRALGFLVLVAMLAGVIIGITEYAIQNIVDPAYGEEITQAAIAQTSKMMPSAPQADIARATSFVRSIWGLVLGSVFFKAINGAFLGLFIAAFIKREPKLADKTEQNN